MGSISYGLSCNDSRLTAALNSSTGPHSRHAKQLIPQKIRLGKVSRLPFSNTSPSIHRPTCYLVLFVQLLGTLLSSVEDDHATTHCSLAFMVLALSKCRSRRRRHISPRISIEITHTRRRNGRPPACGRRRNQVGGCKAKTWRFLWPGYMICMASSVDAA